MSSCNKPTREPLQPSHHHTPISFSPKLWWKGCYNLSMAFSKRTHRINDAALGRNILFVHPSTGPKIAKRRK